MSALNQAPSVLPVPRELSPLAPIAPKDPKKKQRIPALDFTKGSLVLIMVLYHWLNYFYPNQGRVDLFRYLRFLTPSFIFITGFLVSNVYFTKYGVENRRLPARLLERGIKLLAVFAVLNVIRTLLLPVGARQQLIEEHASLRSLVNLYVIGTNLGGGQGKAIAFFILVPIGYLLILSALLVVGTRRWPRFCYFVFGLCALGLSLLTFAGLSSANLQLLTIGLLGVIVGGARIERVTRFVNRPWIVVAAYACYLAAITVWNVIYVLQIVGVCLSLMIIYMIGDAGQRHGVIRSEIILLGQYSLVGYIAQIAILQVLYQAFRHSHMSLQNAQFISFIAAVVLTMMSVRLTHSARRVPVLDQSYRAVFA